MSGGNPGYARGACAAAVGPIIIGLFGSAKTRRITELELSTPTQSARWRASANNAPHTRSASWQERAAQATCDAMRAWIAQIKAHGARAKRAYKTPASGALAE